MRTRNTIRNIFFSFLNMGVTTLLAFVARIIFARILSQEYLGVSGLFTSILTVLSLTELGLGEAICYSLYEPLAKRDIEKIKALMNFYGKIYRLIAVGVLLLGILLLPIYPLMIGQTVTIDHLNAIYLLFVLNTSVSYFYVYKKNLIIYDQHEYIANLNNLFFYGARIVAQSAFLIITKNYIVYLVVQVAFTIFENMAISYKADHYYPFLKEKNKVEISAQRIQKIKKDTYSIMLQKIGDVLLNSMDNIMLSRLFGLVVAGIYSNYCLVFNSLGGIVWRLFSSATASIGNLNASESVEKLYDSFKASFFANAYFTGLMVCCVTTSMQTFIRVAFGKEYLLGMDTLMALIVSFYVNRMRSAATSFRSATGLFYRGRYITLSQAIINILASIVCAKCFGVTGIFIGTSVSILTTTFWMEPMLLYRDIFKRPLAEYFVVYAKYLLHVIICTTLCFWMTKSIPETLKGFILKGGISAVCFSALYFVIFRKSNEMKYFIDRGRALLYLDLRFKKIDLDQHGR